ncbi:MAG TPA: hypothetical protein VKP88_03450 [Candidatus Paceibacterota bacterium]|nr:hypothetical protein [Candidatus Paceibacterota bacterium]
MQDLPKNFGAFLIGLGIQPSVGRTGLSCPAYHAYQSPERRERHLRAAASTGQLDTGAEVDREVRAMTSTAERTFPSRGPSAVHV